MDGRLLVSATSVDGRSVVRVEGELDVATTGALVRAITRSLRSAQEVELDLSRLEFLDAAGIGALLECSRTAVRDGRRVVVGSLSVNAARTLDIAGARDVLLRDGRVDSS